MRHRFAVNLERPSTDTEFLESTVQLGDVLKSLAEEVSDWADSLSGLKLPGSVLSPLQRNRNPAGLAHNLAHQLGSSGRYRRGL